MQIVKMSCNNTLYPSSPKNWPGGQQQQGHEVVLHDQGEVYHQPPCHDEYISTLALKY